jgi:hypothetical protein
MQLYVSRFEIRKLTSNLHQKRGASCHFSAIQPRQKRRFMYPHNSNSEAGTVSHSPSDRRIAVEDLNIRPATDSPHPSRSLLISHPTPVYTPPRWKTSQTENYQIGQPSTPNMQGVATISSESGKGPLYIDYILQNKQVPGRGQNDRSLVFRVGCSLFLADVQILTQDIGKTVKC